MVANHLAVSSFRSDSTPVVGAGAFVGSFAPVLFFLITGLGSGVQSLRPQAAKGSFVRCGLLLIADSFLWLRPGQLAGLDFLGFIGLATLGLRPLQRTARGGRVAVCLAAALVLVRFGLGPLIRHRVPGDTGFGSVVGFFLGVSTWPGFSYPPAPWLTYPLIGYALGRWAACHRGWLYAHRRAVVVGLVGVSGVCVTAAAVLAAHGAVVFRWGGVSLAFYAASWGAVGLGLAAAIGMPARWGKVLALDGMRSLAVVPLHYLIITAVGDVEGPGGAAVYGAYVSLVVIGCFVGSAAVSWVTGRAFLTPPAARTAARVALGGVVVAGWAVLLLGHPTETESATVRGVAQFAACLLLALASVGKRAA